MGAAAYLSTDTAVRVASTSWVFDDHAAWSDQDHWAGPVERGDLATLDLNAHGCDTRPIPLPPGLPDGLGKTDGWRLPPGRAWTRPSY
jgi:hypothetical protein